MGDLGGSGLVVGGGVFAFLLATFSIALRLLLMADHKEDVNYERVRAQLQACERERDAGRARARDAEDRMRAQWSEELAAVRAERDEWKERYLSQFGGARHDQS